MSERSDVVRERLYARCDGFSRSPSNRERSLLD
jgi:hypothetical protein